MDLVTGGTGLVGSHVLLELLGRGRDVRAIHRNASDRAIVQGIFDHYRKDGDVLFRRIQWEECDLLDVDGLAAAMNGIEHVYHCAAMVSFDPRDTRQLFAVNIAGTANVVNAALGANVRRLCHVSSTGAIGRVSSGRQLTETSPWQSDRNTSPYAISKYEAELQVHRGIAEGLDAVIVNPSIVLGPGQLGRSSMAMVERLNRGTRHFPPGSNAVVDARDVAHAMVELIAHGITGERYLLVGDNISYRDLFGRIARALGRPEPHTLARPWMLSLAWRAEKFRCWLTGSRPMITRFTVHTAQKQHSFSSAKVTEQLGMRFKGVDEMLENISTFLARS